MTNQPRIALSTSTRLIASVAIVLSLISVGRAYAQEKPNVVFMMMDNLGWGEIGCYGGGMLRGAETPRLDKLAREGMRL